MNRPAIIALIIIISILAYVGNTASDLAQSYAIRELREEVFREIDALRQDFDAFRSSDRHYEDAFAEAQEILRKIEAKIQ